MKEVSHEEKRAIQEYAAAYGSREVEKLAEGNEEKWTPPEQQEFTEADIAAAQKKLEDDEIRKQEDAVAVEKMRKEIDYLYPPDEVN